MLWTCVPNFTEIIHKKYESNNRYFTQKSLQQLKKAKRNRLLNKNERK